MSKLTLDEAINHLEESLADQSHDWGCEECKGEHEQLLEWLRELREAKQLLKAAVEDFTAIAEVHAAASPILCPQYGKYMKAIDVRTRKWQYADEALALIGEGGENDAKNI